MILFIKQIKQKLSTSSIRDPLPSITHSSYYY